jgi:predicted O-methyltransferase YrrM
MEGLVTDEIIAAFDGYWPFCSWRKGALDRDAYAAQLDEVMAAPLALPLNANKRALSARLHWDPDQFVLDALRRCVDLGLLPSDRYDLEAFRRFEESMRSCWRHEGRSTFIFPEEAQFLYALAEILKPRRIIAAGSYYGYWAAWAIAGAGRALSEAVLLDIAPDVNAIAEANLHRVSLASRSKVVTTDAIGYLEGAADSIDLLVVDAEGPKQGVSPRLRDKAIYGPIAEAGLPKLSHRGLLVAHNILLDRVVEHDYFASLVNHNEAQLAEFIARTDAACPKHLRIPSTEGIGVYMKE